MPDFRNRTEVPVATAPAPTVTPEEADAALPAPEEIETTVVPPVERAVPAQARTAEQFDVTTEKERQVAAAVPQATGETLLGTTVASLGDPSRAGFWLETPLVKEPGKGRVVFKVSGKSSAVDLIPLDGAPTAGSRISLAAMRLIEAPLTELPTIEVYRSN